MDRPVPATRLVADTATRAILLTFASLAVASLLVPGWMVYLLTVIVARALVVLGLVVLWRTGLMSFGQALYFGLGAYAVGLSQKYLGLRDAFALVLLGLAAAVFAAVILGFLLRQYRDIFFAMLSLAFSMILYGTLVKSETLGSTDGFAVAAPTFLGWKPGGAGTQYGLLFLTLAIGAVGTYVVQRYLASPMGHLTTAIRDNEIRVEYLGASVRRAIQVKLGIAGALAGAGGVLSALAVGHIDPGMAYWTSSGEFVFVTILAGAGSVFAPLIGALVFETVRSFAVQYSPETWQMTLGTVLLLVIVFLPGGLWSLAARLRGARA